MQPSDSRTNFSVVVALAFAGVLAASCKDDAPSDFQRVRDATASWIRYDCECARERGELDGISVDACVEEALDFLGYGDMDEDCVQKVYDSEPFVEWSDCYVDAFERYVGCMTAIDCSAPQFECQDNSDTIPRGWVCDGEEDCGDGSDEQGCAPDEGCRVPTTICGDFPDGFDEAMDMCIRRFACADGSGEVPESWVCDGEPDCMDGSDEQNC